MKSMNSNYNDSWLGFSLSPHMSTEVSPDHHHHRAETSSLLLAPQMSNNSSVFYGAENGSLYPQLSVMPLRSDGSLCMMEAFTRSQQEGLLPAASPKLEDFLSGATMGRETMALSLDSLYYQQSPYSDQTSRQQYLDLFQPFRQHIQVQPNLFYTVMGSHDIYGAPLEGGNKQTQMVEESWTGRHHHSSSELDQKIQTCRADGGGSSSTCAMAYGGVQSLSLSMSPGSQSSCVTASQHVPGECMTLESQKKVGGKVTQKQPVHRKSIDTFGQRTSQYRGVTRHRWTGRYEAHLWDNSCKKEGQTRKGRQVYLGGYDMEEKAARAYDLAALKYWGPSTHINFPLESYQEQLEKMKNMSRQEYVAHLRRKSSGFSRGASKYRGVTRHHQHGRWQARIGRVAGNKDLYLGTFSTQEEAAEAYDIAAIKFRGVNAVTNFDISKYDVERIMSSNTLLAGEHARKNKEVIPNGPAAQENHEFIDNSDWKMALFQSSPQVQPAAAKSISSDKSLEETNYKSSSSPAPPLQDMFGIEGVNDDNSSKIGAIHLSNPSSIVTSLSSSREGSPDKNCISMLFTKPDAPRYSAPSPLASWNSSDQLRPAISMAHMPLFAAWSDV